MFELRALSDGTNVALQGLATQSSTLSTLVATNAIDNKNNTFSHTKDANAFWEVDLNHDYVIQEVYVLNRWCQDLSDPTGCMCRLTNATLTLLNSAGSVLAAKTFGDTCTKSELTESFEAHCPTQVRCKPIEFNLKFLSFNMSNLHLEPLTFSFISVPNEISNCVSLIKSGYHVLFKCQESQVAVDHK